MLHRLVYVSAVAGVVHYYWLVKSDITWPAFFGAIITLLRLSSGKQADWSRARQRIEPYH